MPNTIKPYVICVDDEKVILDTLASQIEESPLIEHFQLERAQSGSEALDLIEGLLEDKERIAVVVSDQTMPQMMGDELLSRVHRLTPDTQNILLTGHAQMESVISAINKGKIYRYLTKPWEKEDLVMTIESAGKSYVNKIEHDEQNRLLAKLYEASTLLNSSFRAEDLMESFIRLVSRYTEATAGAIHVHGNHGLKKIKSFQTKLEEVAIPVFAGAFEGEFAGNHQPKSKSAEHVFNMINARSQLPYPFSLSERMKQTRTPYYNNLVTPHSLGEKLKEDPYWQDNRPKSVLAVPFVNNDELIGFVYLELMARYNAFPKETQQFLELLAPTVSIAFSNALLYESLDEHNKQTTESIRATKRIQKALMTPQKSLKHHFAECGILFKPKDIVSGDFYWVKRIDETILVAAADCTGHGIPGAMLSVLGLNLLDRILMVNGALKPDEILKLLDANIKLKLQQTDHDEHSLDGMDICLTAYDIPTQTLHMASANRPLIVMHRSGKQDIYKGDKFPIGGQDFYGDKKFQLQSIPLKDGETVWMFTDGITDQFGGKTGDKKYSLARFQLTVSDYAEKPLETAILALHQDLIAWQGETHQTDDIMVIGFRV